MPLRFWQFHPPPAGSFLRTLIECGPLTGLFLLTDWAFLRALPALNISYGRILVPLFSLFCVRATMLLLWLILPTSRQQHNPASARKLPRIFFAQHLLLSFCVLYTFAIEPFDLRTTYLKIPSSAIHPGYSLRVVQLSDLHIERTTRREREMLATVATLHPDLIVLTGDYPNLSFSDDALTWRQVEETLNQLQAPYGVYAINGSVETPEFLKTQLNGSRVQILDDTLKTVRGPFGEIYLLGVSDRDPEKDASVLHERVQQVPADGYTLLLYHNPDLIKHAARYNVDLYLSGHTHGGQIRVPFYGALITFSAFGKQYERGLYQEGNTTLYVSSGIGMEGGIAPRARFLCPPEIVVVDLVNPTAE